MRDLPAGAVRRRSADPSLAESAAERLRALIVSNTFKPGDALGEPMLVERLGTSRSPVREALRQLATEGLVTLRRNRAAIVSRLDPAELHHLFEAEAAIEGFAASLAALRPGRQDLNRMAELQEALERAHDEGNAARYMQANRQLHSLIVAAARNPILVQMHDRILRQLQRARNAALSQDGRIEQSIREHRAILAAIEAGDGDEARRLVTGHILNTDQAIALLQQAVPSPRGPAHASPRPLAEERAPSRPISGPP
ncbi:GntR family transcriptional regulator [Enterovirga rhinocerotis]|uniref:DNA-binding GntR family transcriptional regulator n=1 Tax=Enterovirga rhinocerotis TaxID=1339210 RepID=A0A4R7BX23_9HYPH|nr:GntR family transcriptional regulator [Enterovirga rhinocerotis]TDR90131.1 DNA-binding GntR family transcriptional regulator [Enterovirga rhinocerotis]